MDSFFGIGNPERGFSSAERIAKSIEASAVNAARAYAGIASSFGAISDILQSAAAVNMIGTVFGNGYVGNGEFFSADRKGINRDSSAKKLPFDIGVMGVSGGIAVALQYTAALEAARNAAFGTLDILGSLGAAVNTVRDNTSGAYEITLSFGGLLGGTIAVALAMFENSITWLRKLCADSMSEIGQSALVLAAFFGGMWNEPLAMAVTRFMWFGNSALSVIGSVVSAVGSMLGIALPKSSSGSSQRNILGGLGENLFGGNSSAALPFSVNSGSQISLFNNWGGLSEVFFGGNSPIIKSDLFNRAYPFTSNKSSAFSGEYIRYDQAFATGYLIGDILTRSIGIVNNGGNSYTNISNANSEKIASGVSKITENTSKSVMASEISAEDLKFLRDIAARDVINRFTTAQVSVSMGGVTNNLSGTADLDGIIDYLANGVKTAMESAAEGVHS